MTTPKQYEKKVLAALWKNLEELTQSRELAHEIFTDEVLTGWIRDYTDVLVDMLEGRSPEDVAKKIRKRISRSMPDPTDEQVEEQIFEGMLEASGRHWKGRGSS